MDNASGHENLLETLARIKNLPLPWRGRAMLHPDVLYGMAPDNVFEIDRMDEDRRGPSPFMIRRGDGREDDQANCISKISELGTIVNISHDINEHTPFVIDVVAGNWSFEVICRYRHQVVFLWIRTITHVPTRIAYQFVLSMNFDHHKKCYTNLIRLLGSDTYEEYIHMSSLGIAVVFDVLRDTKCEIIEESPLINPGEINFRTKYITAKTHDERVFKVIVRTDNRCEIVAPEQVIFVDELEDFAKCMECMFKRNRGDFGYLENGRYYRNDDVCVGYEHDEEGHDNYQVGRSSSMFIRHGCEIDIVYDIIFGDENMIQIHLWYEPQTSPHCQLCVKGFHSACDTGLMPFPHEYHTGTFTAMLAKTQYYVDAISDILQ